MGIPRRSASGEPLLALVIDDDPLVRSTMERILRFDLGCEVLAADGCASAQALLAESEGCIAFAVVDYAMPDVGGIDCARGLLAWRPRLPVVFVSGCEGVPWAEELPEATATFLPKPFGPDELTEAVGRVLGAARGRVEEAG